MPKITVSTSMEVPKEEKTVEFMAALSEILQTRLALYLGVPQQWIGVTWPDTLYSLNMSPLGIEITFSESEKIHPNALEVAKIAKDFAAFIEIFVKLPESITQISVWIMPQHNAAYEDRIRVPINKK